MDLLKSVQLFLTKSKSDKGVNNVITNAMELTEKNRYCFRVWKRNHSPPKEKNNYYEVEDETVNYEEHSFKVNFFFVVLDTAISSLNERFQLIQNHSESFKFLYDI